MTKMTAGTLMADTAGSNISGNLLKESSLICEMIMNFEASLEKGKSRNGRKKVHFVYLWQINIP